MKELVVIRIPDDIRTKKEEEPYLENYRMKHRLKEIRREGGKIVGLVTGELKDNKNK